MEIQLKKNIDKFTGIMRMVSTIALESSVQFKPEGIFFRAVHPSNSLLMTISIDKTFFDIYNVDKEQNIAIDFSLFNNIVKTFAGGFDMNLLETEIVFKTFDKKMKSKLKVFAGKDDPREIPQIDYKNIYKVKISDLRQRLNLAKGVSDVIKLIGTDKIEMECKGQMQELDISMDAEGIYEKEYVYLALEYLLLMTDMADVFQQIELKMLKDHPFTVKAISPELTVEGLLACRSEDSE